MPVPQPHREGPAGPARPPPSPDRLPRLRWGVAGHGDVVVRRGLPGLAALGQEVGCLWGRDRHRAAAAAARYGASGGTDSIAELLGGIDALYVATPVIWHVPLALRALRAGRHVLVEKPLGGALGYDRDGLLAAAAAADAVSAVAYYRRLAPALLAAREALGDGPYRVTARFRAPFAPAADDPMRWRTIWQVSGGGVLADAGSHRIDLLCWLFGIPDQVRGELAEPFPGGAERRADLRLRWPSGTSARLSCQWADGPAIDRLALAGAGRVIRLPRLDSGELIEHNGVQTRRFLPPEPNALIPVLIDFLRAVGGDGRPSCSLRDGAVVDDVLRAARRKGAHQL